MLDDVNLVSEPTPRGIPAPFVIGRDEIQSLLTQAGLELKPFARHSLLAAALPDSRISLAWVSVRPAQCSRRSIEAEHAMLIVLQGNARLVGSVDRTIERGDVVTLPEGSEYAFHDVGSEGLYLLKITFSGKDEAAKSPNGDYSDVTSLDQLLALNERRASEVLENPYFAMLESGALDSPEARAEFRDRARVFCDAFQVFLFMRQATCRDDSYRDTFAEHLHEEIGHNTLMQLSGPRRPFDPVLAATSQWFAQQMLVLDNVGKAALHLVLETGGDYFHKLAKPVFQTDESARYFETHAEDDARHKQMSIDLLRGHQPQTYRSLCRVLDDAWTMLDSLTRRIAYLIAREKSRSGTPGNDSSRSHE